MWIYNWVKSYAAFLDAPLNCNDDMSRLLEVKATLRLTQNESKP